MVGRDFSGEVLSIGDNVKTNVKVGDLVQGFIIKFIPKVLHHSIF